MAMIPEEFPVILTVFLSLGAWRLAKSLARQAAPGRGNAGGGLRALRRQDRDDHAEPDDGAGNLGRRRRYKGPVQGRGDGRETQAYDPMEKAILSYCESKAQGLDGELVLEYPFTNETGDGARLEKAAASSSRRRGRPKA